MRFNNTVNVSPLENGLKGLILDYKDLFNQINEVDELSKELNENESVIEVKYKISEGKIEVYLRGSGENMPGIVRQLIKQLDGKLRYEIYDEVVSKIDLYEVSNSKIENTERYDNFNQRYRNMLISSGASMVKNSGLAVSYTNYESINKKKVRYNYFTYDNNSKVEPIDRIISQWLSSWLNFVDDLSN